jgi:hypothetical protein
MLEPRDPFQGAFALDQDAIAELDEGKAVDLIIQRRTVRGWRPTCSANGARSM